MSNISKKIIGKIKDEHIAPEPKWKFLLKNELFWGMFVVSILLGGLSLGVVIDMMFDNDWDIYQYLNKNFFEYLIIMLPYVWIVFFAIFFATAFYNYKHTKNFYQHNPFVIGFISILASILLGIICYAFGVGKVVDLVFINNVPYYRQMMHQRMIVWNQPERGLISGTITEFSSKDNFIIRNDQGEIWEIKCQDSFWMGRTMPEIGIKIKIIGQKIREKLFNCREVRPWQGGGMMRGMMMNRN